MTSSGGLGGATVERSGQHRLHLGRSRPRAAGRWHAFADSLSSNNPSQGYKTRGGVMTGEGCRSS